MLAFACVEREALAWDETGHSVVVEAAVKRLPESLPAFLRDEAALARLKYLGSEPDRWRNLKTPPMGHINNPDHYFDIELLTPYGLTPQTLPPFRYEFIAHMAAFKTLHPEKDYGYDPARDGEHDKSWPGFAPYRICELYVQLRSSWRTLNTYERFPGVATEAELQAARDNVVYLMGILSHYVADVAQPLHTTIHYDGWKGPNPNGYVTYSGYIHRLLDSGVIEQAGITAADLPADVPAPKVAEERLFEQVVEYIVASHEWVEAVYAFEKRGAFRQENEQFAEGTAFVKSRLAVASAMLAALWESAARDAGVDSFRLRRLEARARAATQPANPRATSQP